MQRIAPIAGFTALLLLGSALQTVAQAEGEPVQASRNNLPAIVVTEVAKRDLMDRVIATGTIRPVDEIYVQPQVEGLSLIHI